MFKVETVDVVLFCVIFASKKMARQSFTVTEPNDQWLKNQINSKEYSSKSELVNDLIRQARNQQKEIDWIRAKRDRAEKGGFSKLTPEEILAKARKDE